MNSIYVANVLIPSLIIYPLNKIVNYTGEKFQTWSHHVPSFNLASFCAQENLVSDNY